MRSEARFHSRPARPAGFDACWAGARITTVLGPLRTDVATIDRRYAELLEALPAASWWRGHPGPVAVDVAGDVMPAALAAGAEPWCSGPPVRVLVGGPADGAGRDVPGRDVAVVHTHGIGDARTSIRLIHDLLTPPGTPFLLPEMRRATALGIAARVAPQRWGRHPAALLAALRRPDPRPRGPVTPVPAHDEPVLTLRSVPVGALRARRDREHPGVTLSATLMAGLVAELGARGMAPAMVSLPVDVRRYLRGRRAGGNLVALLRLTPDADPAVLDRERRRAVDGGEPLLRYLAGRARARLRTVPTAALREPWPTLGWSDRGASAEWDDLPWATGPAGPRRIAAGLAPVWGRRIGVHLTRLGDTLHVSCLVNAAVFPPDDVAAALDAVLDTPAVEGAAEAPAPGVARV
jgi:hypothetical protein